MAWWLPIAFSRFHAPRGFAPWPDISFFWSLFFLATRIRDMLRQLIAPPLGWSSWIARYLIRNRPDAASTFLFQDILMLSFLFPPDQYVCPIDFLTGLNSATGPWYLTSSNSVKFLVTYTYVLSCEVLQGGRDNVLRRTDTPALTCDWPAHEMTGLYFCFIWFLFTIRCKSIFYPYYRQMPFVDEYGLARPGLRFALRHPTHMQHFPVNEISTPMWSIDSNESSRINSHSPRMEKDVFPLCSRNGHHPILYPISCGLISSPLDTYVLVCISLPTM